MFGLFCQAARQDVVSDLGSRRASTGAIDLLRGFDFNEQLPLTTALPIHFTHALDTATGTLKVALPCFIARKRKNFPAEATHFRILSGGVAVNFLCPRYHGKRSDIKTSELLPLHKKTPAAICLEHQVDVEAGEVLVQVLGIEFYKLVNGKEVLVKGSALRILEAVRIEDEAMGTSTQPHEAKLHSCASEMIQQGNEEKEGRQSPYSEASRCGGTSAAGEQGDGEARLQDIAVLRQGAIVEEEDVRLTKCYEDHWYDSIVLALPAIVLQE
jgi:hypothetical protein